MVHVFPYTKANGGSRGRMPKRDAVRNIRDGKYKKGEQLNASLV